MSRIECPKCHREAKNVFDFGGQDDQEAEVDCMGCGFRFIATARVTVRYTVRCATACQWNSRDECRVCGSMKASVTT